MKGLLIKDLQLIKIQKNFFILMFIAAIGIAIFSDNASFIIGYLSFISILFTISTISYDEYDNGNSFLFTLPITRKTYVLEKYSFGVIISILTLIISTILCICIELVKGNTVLKDILMSSISILPILFITLAIIIPFQIKYGSEKGRIATILTIGIIAIFVLLSVNIAEALNFTHIAFLNYLSYMGIEAFITILTITSFIILIISYKISISIMNKKEF